MRFPTIQGYQSIRYATHVQLHAVQYNNPAIHPIFVNVQFLWKLVRDELVQLVISSKAVYSDVWDSIILKGVS